MLQNRRQLILFTAFLLATAGLIALLWSGVTGRPASSATAVANSHTVSHGFIVDRHAIAQFDEIPDYYIAAAAEMTLLFRHASVGDNIDQGLNCLMGITPRPNHCDRDLDPDEIYYDEKYDRSSWDFEFHNPPPNPNPGWWNKVDYFIDRVNGLPSGQYDVVAFKFGYVDGDTNSIIHHHFFDPDSHLPNYTDLEALQAAHPDKIIVWWTMGLARVIGTEPATILNNDMRAYAAANDIILMDIADIVSHTPDGQPCFHNGYPAMCANYTENESGGHLNARGKLYMAKAYWVLMARLANWQPSEPPPPVTPSPMATPNPNLTECNYLPIIVKP